MVLKPHPPSLSWNVQHENATHSIQQSPSRWQHAVMQHATANNMQHVCARVQLPSLYRTQAKLAFTIARRVLRAQSYSRRALVQADALRMPVEVYP